jgi:hypothetical protein
VQRALMREQRPCRGAEALRLGHEVALCWFEGHHAGRPDLQLDPVRLASEQADAVR